MFLRKKKSHRQINNRGFSLLELLLVALLLPLISFAVFANFSSGIRIWKTLNQEAPAEEELNLFYRRASRDFENAFKYSTIHFSGERNRVSFASAIDTEAALGADRGFGQISFFYDADSQSVVRERKNVSELYRNAPGQRSILLKNVDYFEISFLRPGSSENIFKWRPESEAKKNTLPAAVKFDFQLIGSSEKQTRIFSVPAGG